MISRRKLLAINLRNNYRRDVMYFANNWASTLSMFTYVIINIVFIEFLFGNIDSLGSFAKNEAYFLMFVGQVAFYIQSNVVYRAAQFFSEQANTGALDFVLIRPMSHSWHVFTQYVSLLQITRGAVPGLVALAIVIDWGSLSFTPISLIAGLALFVMGYIIDHVLIFSITLTSIWTGTANFSLHYFWIERAEMRFPFEDTFGWFKFLMFTMFPVFIISSLSVSVMLGKTSLLPWLPLVAIITMFAVWWWQFAWGKAMQHYTSASS
jgi:ABC-type uncharacterized transport system permease subunit